MLSILDLKHYLNYAIYQFTFDLYTNVFHIAHLYHTIQMAYFPYLLSFILFIYYFPYSIIIYTKVLFKYM